MFMAGLLWIKRQPAKQQRLAWFKLLLGCLLLMLVFLAVSGRLHWLAAIFATLIPFARKILPLIRYIPLLRSFVQSKQPQTGKQSEVTTQILHMTLDHDSGVMHGTVLQGPQKDQQLGDMSKQQFLQLLSYCRQHDPDSTRLLETYLDKRFGQDWRQDDPQNESQPSSTVSDLQQACEILGVAADASADEVIEAHRRLMQKLHPDRGGSTYLAAQINEAKDLLLKKKGSK